MTRVEYKRPGDTGWTVLGDYTTLNRARAAAYGFRRNCRGCYVRFTPLEQQSC